MNQTAIRLLDGTIIQGTGIKDIDKGSFVLNDVNITQAITARSSIMYYKGIKFFEINFDGPVPMVNGDTLRIKQYPDFNGIKPGDPDFEEMVQKYLEQRNLPADHFKLTY